MSSSTRSLSRQSGFTFTRRSRNTFVPKNFSRSSRASVPIRLIMSPARPMTIGFCDSVSTKIVQYRRRDPLALLFVELVDDHRGRKGQLVACVLQHFFAHGLGNERALGLIRQVVVGKSALPFRHLLEQHLLQALDAVTRRRRHRHDRREVVPSLHLLHQRQQSRLRHEVDLVEHEHRRVS